MNKYDTIKKSIIKTLQEDKIKGEMCDLSDIGNLIGMSIGPFISEELGYEKDAFIHGVKHGISLIDGTH